MMARVLQISKTCRSIGMRSVGRVVLYRLACRSGAYRLLLPVRALDGGPFFRAGALAAPPLLTPRSQAVLLERSEALLRGELEFFSRHLMQVGAPPDWFLDPFSGNRIARHGHWSRLDEFASADIKTVWEPSRCEWAPLLARAYRVEGDARFLDALNGWLADWVRHNPVNSGPNWKCGQEAAIRCLNLLLTARLLGSHRAPEPALVTLVARHLERILPSIGYAIGQDNNHGTSEAAALYVGGAWLAAVTGSGSFGVKGSRFRAAGRRWLEERVQALVGSDGSFSQYSVNYHRVLLDTLCQVESWRRELGEQPFGERYLARCRSAALWLASLTDRVSGNAPNVGANDGARLYDLSCAPYRDYRPTVQLACTLFYDRRAYSDPACDEPLSWLELEPSQPELLPVPESAEHREGGDVVLREGEVLAMIRFANYRFRPGHTDCLHLDLWRQGVNLLRDGGSYCYNTEPRWLEYFTGPQSHNTVQFDGRGQMPRLGRFLFGEWLRMDQCSGISREGAVLVWSGAYVDWMGGAHKRTVRLGGLELHVVDEVHGHRDRAVLRWRLAPGPWRLSGNLCSSPCADITIHCDSPLRRIELVGGWESLEYLDKSELPVLEAEAGPGRCVIETTISLR